jgi:hypothetical protein
MSRTAQGLRGLVLAVVVNLFLSLARGYLHHPYGVPNNVSRALLAFGSFGH